jgi:hypothetical protein
MLLISVLTKHSSLLLKIVNCTECFISFVQGRMRGRTVSVLRKREKERESERERERERMKID